MIRRVMRAFGGQQVFFELLALVVVVLAAAYVSAEVDLLERYVEWARAHEEYELDELLMLAAFGLMGAIVFTIRRISEVRREIARREASEARARYLAYHDSLTGLANREQGRLAREERQEADAWRSLRSCS